jgi:hypothetical protein
MEQGTVKVKAILVIIACYQYDYRKASPPRLDSLSSAGATELRLGLPTRLSLLRPRLILLIGLGPTAFFFLGGTGDPHAAECRGGGYFSHARRADCEGGSHVAPIIQAPPPLCSRRRRACRATTAVVSDSSQPAPESARGQKTLEQKKTMTSRARLNWVRARNGGFLRH